jgi:hypothetical protein
MRAPLRRLSLFVLLSFIALAFFFHQKASFGFPTPWGDEADFLWQAIGFQQHNSLYSPELNPERTVMWMPPGYMIFAGIVFKVFGFSFYLARLLSFVLVSAAFLALYYAVESYRVRPAQALICGLFLLTPEMLAAANVARMEALLLMLVCSSFLLFRRNQWYPGLALLWASLLVHPNGLLFLIAALIYFVAFVPKQARMPVDNICISIVALLWFGYSVFIVFHFGDFLHDMRFQILYKVGRFGLIHFLNVRSVLLVALMGSLGLYSWKRKVSVTLLSLTFAVPAFLILRIGNVLWYQAYERLCQLLILLSAMHVLEDVCHNMSNLKLSITNLAVCALLAAQHPFSALPNVLFGEMTLSNDVPYMTEQDIDRVQKFLSAQVLIAGRPITIEFFPAGDSLFFANSLGRTVSISQPTLVARTPDAYIVHISERLPRSWPAFHSDFTRTGVDLANQRTIIAKRDAAEVWYFITQSARTGK